MQNTLNKIYEEAIKAIENAKNSNDIEEIKLNYLSRKGELNTIKKMPVSWQSAKERHWNMC